MKIIAILLIALMIISAGFLSGCSESTNSITVDELLDNSLEYDGENVTVRGYIEFDQEYNTYIYNWTDLYKLWDKGKKQFVELAWVNSNIKNLDDYTYIEVSGEFAYYEYINPTIYPVSFRVLE